MKCPKCSYNQSYNNGMICNRCKYRFILDPKRDGFADNKFVTTISSLLQQGMGFFTFHQFYAMLYKRSKKTNPLFVGIAVALMVSFMVISMSERAAISIGFGLIIGVLTYIGIKSSQSKAPAVYKIQKLWNRWLEKTVIPVDGYLSLPEFTIAPEQTANSDWYDYGVEGLLIVDQPIYVDLLVKNKIHSEYRLLVMASDTYPHFLLEQANKLLSERKDLPVYLLHNATANVKSMTDRFALQGHAIYDLGLSLKVYETHPRLKPFSSLLEKPLDVLSLNAMRLLLRRATDTVNEEQGDGYSDGGWIFWDDTSDWDDDAESGGRILVSEPLFDEAMEDGDADGGDFG
ncbi:MAG: hypothetical protein AAGJ93_14510 [Bacteroidota bacterium]